MKAHVREREWLVASLPGMTDVSARRAESDARADRARPLPNDVRHHAVDPDRGRRERRQGEDAQE
ncbi:MAG TPA: hypothetical protein VFD67_08425 [Gemmatimonadaceae bacterium]|nr:hypothetical protein [Gemmatimonadaceae bacterium]